MSKAAGLGPIGDVHAVYTWVNDQDEAWQAMHSEASASRGSMDHLHDSVFDKARFQNRDELRYSINSLKRYAPWVSRIFVVTNCTLPDWAASDPLISRVDHGDIFPESKDLPTFNAFAIEACLHRIDGLAEHFIYFNDDVFLLRPRKPQDFFPAAGRVSLFLSRHDMPAQHRHGLRPVEFSMLNARDILKARFNFTPTRRLEHAPFPLLRSVMYEIENELGEELAATRSHQLRDPSDLPLSTTLHAYWCLASGRGEVSGLRGRYVDIGDPLFIFLVMPFSPMRRGKYAFLCLNEVSSARYLAQCRDAVVTRLMKSLFPPVSRSA